LPSPEPPPLLRDFRVLVVEDEFLIAMELDAVLQEAGFTVVGPVSSVGEALDAIQAERPDAAVLDVSLYGQRVTPVAQVLLSIETPFVLTSAYQPSDLAPDAALASARNLGKPTPHAELVKVLLEMAAARPVSARSS
jgi:DNA-binding response OmpR family regulator